MRPWLLIPLAALVLAPLACGGDDEGDSGNGSCRFVEDEDAVDYSREIPPSCAFQCGGVPCEELTVPFACPAMGSWEDIPHAEACGCFSGAPPATVQGACSVSDPSGEATRLAGPSGPQSWVLPDGHLIEPAGVYAHLDEDDLSGTFPMSLVRIPGTRLVLSSDGGLYDNALRLLNIDELAAGRAPTAAHVRFARPESLYYGVVWLAPDTALASGGGDGMVYAFDVDTTAATLTRNSTRDIDLGPTTEKNTPRSRWYAGPMASADGSRLLVAPSSAEREIQVRSLDAGAWGELIGTIPLNSKTVFELVADPFDPNGNTFYATMWDDDILVELDADALAVTRSINIGKNPEGIAFIDSSFMVVASADADVLVLVDRTTWTERARIDLHAEDEPLGHGPSAISYDASKQRLYATLSGVNAVAAFDVSVAGNVPTIAPIGRIPTAWWPTGVVAMDDGSLAILAGKGIGTGPDEGDYEWTDSMITRLMRGGVQHVPYPTQADLSAMTATADGARRLASTPGYPEVTCPEGADDFPVPVSPSEGPSERIKRVVYVIRENKTYDAVFGDMPGTNGDPSLVMAPGDMERIWPNARKIAQSFTNFDNYYTSAEQSIQGHVWTTFGQTSDFVERTWMTAWGRATRLPTSGIADEARPGKGSIFESLDRAGVSYANMGEVVGIGEGMLDPGYPGLIYALNKPDIEKACYIAGRARVRCDLPSLSYVVLPNDHTEGGTGNAPHPGVFIAVNDEATGRIVDAISHSPLWPETLIIFTEDDPQNGADHVDVHRTLLFMASPWVRRGYVSRGHYDISSVHKLILSILGVPYPNEQIAQSAIPFDAFTSTPDYTPFEFEPRVYEKPCNPEDTRAAREAEGWDFSEPDEQPGIARWTWKILHDGEYE